MWLFLPLIALCVLYRREMRTLAFVLLIILGAATWYTASFFADRYDHWVACGRPTIGTCAE
jgi:hypothetical protein